MTRNEKKEKKAFISEHLNIGRTYLNDEEVDFLVKFIEEYDEKYRGQTDTKKSSFSDGKITRWEEKTYTFTDDIGIQEKYKYHNDNGTSGGSYHEIKDAKGILKWFKKR
jgi:hypothetical protein